MAAARVLVIGLGVTGDAVVRHLAGTAEVVVLDDRGEGPEWEARAADARRRGAEVVTGAAAGVPESLGRVVDLVVPSPGVPESHPAIAAALAAGVPVRSEVDLAAERATAPIVAVTGTNGKSTVTTLVAHLLSASGIRAVAAGNLGRPLLDAVDDDVDVVVAEVSSFQLRFAETLRPRVGVLLNVADDHLDWHGGFDRYAAAKARVFEHQRDGDLAVYVADDEVAARIGSAAPARRVAVTLDGRREGAWRPVGDDLVDPAGVVVAPRAALRRDAPHDVVDALASLAAACEVGATPAGARAGLATFEGLPHRLVPVGQHGGVRWFDDSKATNPHATIAAVEGFDSVVLVAGGRNKGVDLRTLRRLAPRLRHVVAVGEAAGDLEAAFAGAVPVTHAASMRDAVSAASRAARPGDAVLLSPACASFDWYPGYAARGDDFAREVRALLGAPGRPGTAPSEAPA